MIKRSLRFSMYLLAAALLLPALPAVAASPVADVALGTVQVEWQPTGDFAGMKLRVSGPLGVTELDFGAGENPLFDLRALESAADGLYTWEIVATPRLDEGTRRAIATSRTAGDAPGAALRSALPDPGSLVQSGSFRVVDGAILQPTDAPEPAPQGVRRVTSDATGGGATRAAAEDVVYNDDVIITGSLCVGFDCVNNESFGFDTIRLKENNTRIKFEDTSSSTGFPTTDWQLTANDSASGGLNKFSVEDITSARVPFTITGGAPTNSIFVDSTGRVGFRTSTPVLDLHVSTTNTPAIRLEQTSAGGFTAQTWDIAGNEANFFVRDVTSGSRLPFRIRPGAPTSSVDIAADGDVGIGTASPQDKLDVRGTVRVTGGDVAVREDDDGNNAALLSASDTRGTLELLASGGITTALNRAGGISFMENNLGLAACQDPDHDLVIGGTGAGCNTGTFSEIDAGEAQFTVSSSRHIKTNLTPVRIDGILEKVASVPVYSYDFIDGKKDRIGLVAEDFHAIFQRGPETMLSGHEMQLALWLAVQELAARAEEVRAQEQVVDQLREANEELNRRLAAVEASLAPNQR